MANWNTLCFTPPWRRSGVGLKRCSGSPKDSRRADRRHVSGQPSDRLQLGGTIPPARRARPPGTPPRRPTLGPPSLDFRDHDPLIEAAFAQDPRELGYQSTVWTTELLVHYLGQAHGIEASPQERELGDHRLNLRWKRPRHQLASRPGTLCQQRGLKRGRKDRSCAVLLMLDETIVTETPPLYSRYGPIGEQVRVPISGTHNKRVLHGAINIRSGDLALLITEDWTQDSHKAFLRLIRAHWRGWNLVLFEDRASQHKAARAWGLRMPEDREWLLPKATPELNAMDHLWRHTKRVTLGSRATLSIEASALAACQYLIDLSPRERLRKAGVLSGNFWLTR